jgi:NAD(P)H-dependent FMN reductase
LNALKIGIIMSTTRAARFADRAADWIAEHAREHGRAQYETVDLRDYPLPFFSEAAAPLFVPVKNDDARRWNAKIASFDGYIFVTAEYNHGIPGALKNAIDHSYHELVRKPAAFVGYGSVGAARAIEQLRLVLAELQMAPVRNAVHVGMAEFLGMLQQGKTFADYPYLGSSATALLDDLLWWTETLKRGREKAA